MSELSAHQAQRKDIRDRLISAYASGGVKAVVKAHDDLPEGSHEYARDWLDTYGAGTWQRKASKAIERSAYVA